MLEKMCPELSWQQPRPFRSQEGDFQGPSRMLWPGHRASSALTTHEGREKKELLAFSVKGFWVFAESVQGENLFFLLFSSLQMAAIT